MCWDTHLRYTYGFGPLLGGTVFLREIERLNKSLCHIISKSLYYKTGTGNSDCETIFIDENHLSLFSEGKTGGQLQWTHGSLGEAVRIWSAQDTGETPAGVQVNEEGVVREAETLEEKERGEQKQWQLIPVSKTGSCRHFLWEFSAEAENI